MFLVFLLSYFLVFSEEPSPAPSPTPTAHTTPKEAKTTEKKEKAPVAPPRLDTTKKAKLNYKGAPKSTNSAIPTPTPFLAEEAVNLLIPNQKYILKFEDEESFGKIQAASNSINTVFSPQEVETFQKSIRYITDYRNQMKQRCFGDSSRKMNEALEKYLAGLCQFNRKALAMVADITENNSAMILVINRSTLVDAPVLVSRYFQFKKQRYKENMQRFLKDDNKLVSQMAQVAKIFKVDLTDETWNKTYGLRENGLENISQWPRELVFQATEKLASAKEGACILNFNTEQDTKLAE